MGSRLEGVSKRFPWLVVEEGEQVPPAKTPCTPNLPPGSRLRVRQPAEGPASLRLDGGDLCLPEAGAGQERAGHQDILCSPGQVQGQEQQLAVISSFRLRDVGKHTAIGIMTQPNPASEQFHRKMGFTKVWIGILLFSEHTMY